MSTTNEPTQDTFEHVTCDLCIIGAGIAGLNTLSVASKYLPRNAKVVIIDRNPTFGGMWNDTYDYVRLHQPHPLFTAGDIPWTLDKPPSHLATKQEILEHFAHCVRILGERLSLEQRYGYLYVDHREVAVGGGYEVEVICDPVLKGARPLKLHARRCIKAFGWCVPVNPALKFTSGQVNSISPHGQELLGKAMEESDKPVYVIGGGKTGMDTAYALITRFPGKTVHLIVGEGTVFISRDKLFPNGLRRWWGGTTNLASALDIALHYNGRNEEEVFAYFKRHYAVMLDTSYRNFIFGIISEAENEVIAHGTREVLKAYLDDICDENGQATMVLRSGARRTLEAGTWIVNCTGYVRRKQQYEPYLSAHGAVLSIQPTSTIHPLSTFNGYFLAHMFFLDKLQGAPLYEIDLLELRAQNKIVFPLACFSQILYNTLIIMDTTPPQVLRECGLDLDRLYPLLRRLLGLLKLILNKERYKKQFRAALDVVHEKFNVRCGLLGASAPVCEEGDER